MSAVRKISTIIAVLTTALGIAAAPGSAAAPTTPGVLTGFVTDTEGAALVDVTIRTYNLDSFTSSKSTRTDGAGAFRLELRPGSYYLVLGGAMAHGGHFDENGYVGTLIRFHISAAGAVDRRVELRAGGSVSGRVTDSDGRPLGGIDAYLAAVQPYVFALDSGFLDFLSSGSFSGQAYTQRDGTFTIRGVPAGAYLACYEGTSHPVSGGSAGGYLSTCTQSTIVVRARTGQSVPAVALTASQGGGVAGIVRDASGHPMPYASVDIGHSTRLNFAFVTADRRGAFTALGLPQGSLSVCSQGDPDHDRAPTGSARTCRKVTVRAGVVTTADLDLQPGGAVSGVVRSGTGKPVSGASVGVRRDYNSVPARTDARGRYRLTGVAAGTTTLCVDTYSATVEGAPGGAVAGCGSDPVRVRVGEVTSADDIVLNEGGAVSGTLRDSTGAPIRNAQIELSSRRSFHSAVSRNDGTYLVRGLDSADYFVCVGTSSLGGSGQVRCTDEPVHVTRGEVTTGVDFTFRAGGTVKVQVQDADGHPVAGANTILLRKCSVEDDVCDIYPVYDSNRLMTVGASWTTDQRGRVSFDDVRPGTYVVCSLGYHAATAGDTSPTGYADVCSDVVHVAVGSTSSATQVLRPGGVVTARVLDTDGNGIAGAVLHVTGSPADDVPFSGAEDGPQDAYRTAADGTVTVTGVRPGKAEVCVDARDAQGAGVGGHLDRCLADPVRVAEGRTTDAGDITLASGGAITGHVTGLTGRYPELAILVFRGRDIIDESSPVVEGDGAYVIDRLEPGTYQVCFEPFTDQQAQCYDDVPWDDDGRHRPPLDQATKLTVTAGGVVENIDATLHSAS